VDLITTTTTTTTTTGTGTEFHLINIHVGHQNLVSYSKLTSLSFPKDTSA
jgi:hypothetical protein